MNNYEIADQFSLLTKLMEIHGENSFKIKSYSIAAFNIERLPAEVGAMDDTELFKIKGIGDKIGKNIRELQSTGKLAILDALVAQTPPGILDMLEIKGLGPKKIATIWTELGIESLGELEYACNENRLTALKGFGQKTQESVLQSIIYFNQNLGFYLWAETESFTNSLLSLLKAKYADHLTEPAGDFRRQSNTLELIDFVTTIEQDQLIQAFAGTPDTVAEPLADGRLLVRTPGKPHARFLTTGRPQFYASLFSASASDEFLAGFASAYQLPDEPESEEAIFAANKLAFVPPMLRETAPILENAANNQLPQLIQPSDIRGIIHSHSNWSDGVNTIAEMAKAAKDKGLEYLVLSDHSQTAFYAGGLKPDRILAQHHEIDALNEKLAPFKIFKSIESDILNDGKLDYDEQVLRTFDLVIASVHSNLKMSQDKAMERVLAAVRNPYTTILGHPTGRLLLSRKGYPLDHKKLIDTCAERGVVIEINAHPRRLDLDWQWIAYALQQGVLLSIDPDAHSIAGYKDTYYGVKAAQKGGLTAQHNLSSFTLKQFEAFLAGRNGK